LSLSGSSGGDATEFDVGSDCHQDLDIMWRTKMELSTMGTPIIADIFQYAFVLYLLSFHERFEVESFLIFCSLAMEESR
jgi:hypothetical protein